MSSPDNKKLFLSAASSEFCSYRTLLAGDLKRPNLDIETQETFIVTGGSTLEKLDTYIRQCHAIIHLIGKAAGAVPPEFAVAALLRKYPDFGTLLPPLAEPLSKLQPGFSYTQWEAYLAIYHKRELFVYRPDDFESDTLDVPRKKDFVFSSGEFDLQKQHYDRIRGIGHDRGWFSNEERLSSAVLRDLVEILPRLGSEVPVEISRIVKFAPAELIGRESETEILDKARAKIQEGESMRPRVLTIVALGGEGKTSLVAKWAAILAHQDNLGFDAVFAWSFYSQGTREQTAVSSDLFFAEAIAFFGGSTTGESAKDSIEKGRTLSHLIGKRRALLILDGLEPLQYSPTSPAPGELKDQGLAALLKGLAASGRGLCVVTTRYAIPDLRAFERGNVMIVNLAPLSRSAGVALLQSFKLKGSLRQCIPSPCGTQLWNEFEKLVEDVKGHALTLNLLGSYLHLAHAGNIRKRDLVKLEEADAEEQGGHAFRVMDAYVESLANSGKTEIDRTKGKRALAILQLLAFFDRPSPAGALAALWEGEAIPGLTEELHKITEAQRNVSIERLQEARLLTVIREEGSGELLTLDTHPLVREYFATRLQETQLEAWREGHLRLYRRLCSSTGDDKLRPSLEDLEPLYQAISHACSANQHQIALDEVYRKRIHKKNEFYSITQLGAITTDLGALACFFENPWVKPQGSLYKEDRVWILERAAESLRSLGRISEAFECMKACRDGYAEVGSPAEWVLQGVRLCEFELIRGKVAESVKETKRIETEDTYRASLGGHSRFENSEMLLCRGWILYQNGKIPEAEALFEKAEAILAKSRLDSFPADSSPKSRDLIEILVAEADAKIFRAEAASPEDGVTGTEWSRTLLLRAEAEEKRARKLREKIPAASFSKLSLPTPTLKPQETYRFCIVLMAAAERAAWKRFLGGALNEAEIVHLCHRLDEVDARVDRLEEHYSSDFGGLSLRDQALRKLIMVRSAINRSLIENTTLEDPSTSDFIEHSVRGLRRASMTVHIPLSLLTRAWLGRLTATNTSDSAENDLGEAYEIAQSGPMPLFIADIHLHRARLFFRDSVYPWKSPRHDLGEARQLILDHGYLRRMEELEDAEAAILS
jgi:hypothetical protein